MSASEVTLPPCPLCHGNRVHARLKSPGFGNTIFLDLGDAASLEELDSLYVEAWLCTNCGHVELYAHIGKISHPVA
jgi:hypothetical protein